MIPFEKDTFIPQQILKLKEQYDIKLVIETGTQYGYTTNWFAGNFDKVVTIEADHNSYVISRKILAERVNVTSVHGKSESTLIGVIKQAKTEAISPAGKILFYLDAHGCEIGGTALVEELRIIGQLAPESIVLIHDFKNPLLPHAGYDSYDGIDLDMNLIEPYLADIYPNGYDASYNTECNGANRGIIYLTPAK